MKKQEKIFEVENLAQKVKDSKGVYLADYRGLSAQEANNLRASLRKIGAELQVTKNTLIMRAFEKASLLPLPEKSQLELVGPTIALFAGEDEISPLKQLLVLGKAGDKLGLKFGFIEGIFQDGSSLSRLASLPGKTELRAKLMAVLNQPAQRLVFDLNFNLQKLAILLCQIGKKSN